MRTAAKIALIYPDGEKEFYSDCVIEDSLLPDLAFTGTHMLTEVRERVLTNIGYKIVTMPVLPPKESTPEEKAESLSNFFGVPWRDREGVMHNDVGRQG